MISTDTVNFINALNIALKMEWWPTLTMATEEEEGLGIVWSTKQAYADIEFVEGEVYCSARRRGKNPVGWEVDPDFLAMALLRMRRVYEGK